ncbi:DEHA2E00286p [Debaryomyces hansenii CBS767]|uniref:DEHA2E00286p n=1 Tax=Debaryomyces hansenii (strain ATCC 36239 / CBS 767 / BCRC 21394 / JCM 1990 / NBRC 0083 / IGC 2968) TaxID=284592 RepID=Q6BR31_DEBHA|nr:DEHA2E00286p [Debaryomyces hansenii CBS767]CAG87518.2 DEHA2E00286p [Debaryomyces hansenii CBS767]|eukprot:XP_459339.2 DEHA2E00286p [Debaryomyces hansenii CBS767]
MPIDEWNMDSVYEFIKARLNELHSLGISHNDVRQANIHV